MKAILFGPYSFDCGLVGPRLGGAPPQGIQPRNEKLTYLLTVPILDTEEEISVFIPDFDSLISNRRVIHSGGLVECIVHAPSERCRVKSPFESRLSGHAMTIGNEIDESQDDPTDSSKLGGYPYLTSGSSKIAQMITSVLSGGGIQVLQLDVPGPPVLPRGNWPFGNGIFHIFGRPPFAAADICTFWEM